MSTCLPRPFRVALIACLASLSLPAAAEIFKCTDAQGSVTYSNMQGRNCKRLNVEPPSGGRTHSSVGSSGGGSTSTSPSSFPRVDGPTQKARDDDRRRILEQEVAAEQKNLEQARRELAEQEAVRSGDERNYQRVLDRLQPFKDRVALHERNIEAIRKEISNLR
jgi:hypothetical protein